jgi:hypothetical protein
MLAYRSRMKSALDGLDGTPMSAEWRDNNRVILQNNIAFMDDCTARGVISFKALESFGKKQAPYLAKNVAWAAQTQVARWVTALADWKAMLGADWDKTDAASNTIYLMDYELMDGDARAAIIAESGKRGVTPLLRFGSHQWPTLITPGPGAASVADLK